MVSHEDRIKVMYNSPYHRMRIDYRVVGENSLGVFPGTWFLYDVDPLPEYEELLKIVSGMKAGIKNYECINNGKIHYRKDFEEKGKIDESMTKTVVSLRPKTYRVAIWLGNEIHGIPEYLNGYPPVVILNEEINRYTLPEHKHLNEFFESDKYYMPESLCFKGQCSGPKAGKNIVKTIEDTIHWTSEWLLKHRIYESTLFVRY